MQKRIAFVVQRFGAGVVGGSETLCRAVARRLTSRYHLDVLTTCALDYQDWKNHYRPGIEQDEGIEVHRFRVEGGRRHVRFHALSKSVLQGPHSLRQERAWMESQGPIAPDLYRHLDAERDRYAAVLFFTYLYPTTVDGITIAPERSILVPTAHDEPPLYLQILRPVFTLPRRIIYNTEEERDLVHRVFRNCHVAWDVAGVGVDLHSIKAPGPRADCTFLYLGRVDVNKGVRELATWFAEASLGDSTLVIAGTPVVKLPKHPRVRVLGEVTEPQKTDLLEHCRALIVPSLYESLSLVALEAWSYGKPVVARRGSSVLEGHLRKGGGGLLFSDATSLRAALRQLHENPLLAGELGARGRRYVESSYTWERILAIYGNAIESVAESRHSK